MDVLAMKRYPFYQCLFALIIAAFLCLPPVAHSHQKRIVFFLPTTENNTYWPQVIRVLKAAAEDLGVLVETHAFDVRDRFARHVEGKEILKAQPRPDAAILSVAYGDARPLLETAESLGIPVFIQGPLFPSELPEIGYHPRKVFKQWVGYFYQDEMEKGYRLGKALIAAAHDAAAASDNKSLKIVGIGGDFTWFGSRLRQDGLVRAVEETPDAQLLQVVPTHWTQAEGKRVTRLLLNRYPQASIFWAASDQLGIGAAEALVNAGRILGRTAFVGGLDLSMNGLRHVKNGRLIATVAGSILIYAEIMVYLHDYLNGIDFADDVGTQISSPIQTVTSANVDLHLALYQSLEAIDFSRLSKIHNPELTHYNFSLQRLSAISENGKGPKNNKLEHIQK